MSTRPVHRLCTLAVLELLAVSMAGCQVLSHAVPRIGDVKEKRLERNAQVMEQFDRQRDEAQFQAALGRWHVLDVQGCQACLAQILSRDPNHREALCLLAELAVYVEQPEMALGPVQRLAADRPDDALVHHSLAMLLEAGGQPYGALEHFQRAAHLEPKNELYRLSLESAGEAVHLAANANARDRVPAADEAPSSNGILSAAR